MKIAITATGADLEAKVDPRFGRCACFLFVETDDLSFEATENPNVTLGGGAGIQSGQLVAAKGVTCVLTGNCGPNAYQTLSAAGIVIVTGCSGTVRDAIRQYKAGQLTPTSEPNVTNHFGMGGGRGRGAGRGMGGGMGRRQGRGTGDGGGFAGNQSSPTDGGEEELSMLKQQAEVMGRELQQIQRRIHELE